MSQQNVEIFRRALDAFNRRDKPACLALCDPEIEWWPPVDWPEAGMVRGRDAVWDLMLELNEPWEDGDYEVTELIEAGEDKLVLRDQRRVQGRASGIDTKFDYWVVATFRGDVILRLAWFAERSEAREAAGLGSGRGASGRLGS